MKRAIVIVVVFLFFSPGVEACVGKTLNIGVVNASEGQVLAEMLSTLINERTGTTVKVRFYKNAQDLYEAVKVRDVDISIENTTRAMHLLNKSAEGDVGKVYEIVKTTYEKEKGLVWLKPFAFFNGNGAGSPSYTSVILRVDILRSFPALPRLFEKVGSMINDEAYTKLIKSVESGDKPQKVARDFLKSRKVI